VAHRDQFGGLLGGSDAGEARYFERIPFGLTGSAFRTAGLKRTNACARAVRVVGGLALTSTMRGRRVVVMREFFVSSEQTRECALLQRSSPVRRRHQKAVCAGQSGDVARALPAKRRQATAVSGQPGREEACHAWADAEFGIEDRLQQS